MGPLSAPAAPREGGPGSERDAGGTFALFLAGAAVIFPSLWVLPLCDPSEARYAEAAREMAQGGSWLVPHLMGHPHLTKPPLTYWLSALSMELFGPRAWAARLPAACAFLATVMVVADLGRRLWSTRAGGQWAGWALLFSALPLAASSILTTDTLLAFFETAAVWCALRSATAERGGRGWALGFHAALALAFLVKGPPGLLGAAALIPFAVRYRRRYAFRRLLSPLGFALFALLGFPWWAAVAREVPGVLSAWWEVEVLERVAGDSHRNMPFILYFPILLGGALPAGLLLPGAARWLWREVRARGPDRPPAELILFWTGLPLAVLCASRSRLPLYLLPLFPPLALLSGRWAARRWQASSFPRRVVIPLVAAASLLGVGVRLAAPHVPGILMPDPRPAARAIIKDARAAGARPQTFVTTRFSAVPACGLGFYLNAAVERLELHPRVGAPGPGEPPPLTRALAQPEPPGTVQYFAVRPAEALLFGEQAGGLSSGRWLLRRGGLWVWRREG